MSYRLYTTPQYCSRASDTGEGFSLLCFEENVKKLERSRKKLQEKFRSEERCTSLGYSHSFIYQKKDLRAVLLQSLNIVLSEHPVYSRAF